MDCFIACHPGDSIIFIIVCHSVLAQFTHHTQVIKNVVLINCPYVIWPPCAWLSTLLRCQFCLVFQHYVAFLHHQQIVPERKSNSYQWVYFRPSRGHMEVCGSFHDQATWCSSSIQPSCHSGLFVLSVHFSRRIICSASLDFGEGLSLRLMESSFRLFLYDKQSPLDYTNLKHCYFFEGCPSHLSYVHLICLKIQEVILTPASVIKRIQHELLP